MNASTAYAASFGATFAAAVIGSVASVRARQFYGSLAKPAWAPAGNVFGPVWTVVYVMMALAAAIAWAGAGGTARVSIVLFLVQLALNALWSWVFFRAQSGRGSMAVIALLWLAIVATLVVFWNSSVLAGTLMLPYLAWVTFAAALNYTVWRHNPGLL